MTVTEPVTGSVPTTARTPNVSLPQRLGGNDGRRHVRGRERPGCHDRDTVGVTGGEVEVVEDGEHGEAIIGQLSCQIEHLHPVVQVEATDRLIEQQHRRLGGERRLGEGETLQVAAGQRVDGLVGEMLGIEVHGACHRFTVRCPLLRRSAAYVGVAPSQELRSWGASRADLRHHAHERRAAAVSSPRAAPPISMAPTAAASHP